MTASRTIALFPEASFGAALNCVGIAQELRRMGARPVFICHPGFSGVFAEYGFAEYQLGGGTESTTDWTGFIARHQSAFRQSPDRQLDSYVGPTWDAIVDTAIAVEMPLRQLLSSLKPDGIVLDNVVMFPAIANAGVPWIRVISCAETELPDPNVPPYLSGLGLADRDRWADFARRYEAVTAPAHKRFSAFLTECGLVPPPAASFLDPSPWLNLLLAPQIIRHDRAVPLDPERFVFLDGCVRQEADYQPPRFATRNDAPLVLTSFGSLGAMDVGLTKRMIEVFADLPCRFLVNGGPWSDEYSSVPDNVYVGSWFPQPSVVAQSSLFIHHGGNNSFCEALTFGVPSLVMPYCWDGHDNARRADETGVGRALDRYRWEPDGLAEAIRSLLADDAMKARLQRNAVGMQAHKGARRAAKGILDAVNRADAPRRAVG
ncbi:glycosyl transferase family 1 [Aquibium carbonis]|uniref:Glycosyl transferase family 1 n=1 Tax=Aquibium carbonis TaxID=2495581 RepID=A0A3R9YRZ7_9HYPH|nr:glycosyltransferase [Aquibium carbonis]RST85734.1 glycosyl transferase family 1 [Aquibium carbonis]